ncbi:hypothetical protein [Allocoleopsis sp.]|uniref:hypothetical protein n=1 Tax=Allocoleopsis sp. TaxID=3088169 RepID=UPI002FD291AB
MSHVLRIKGFQATKEHRRYYEFQAIVPIFSMPNDRPINYVRINGIGVPEINFDWCEDCDWHPESLSQEKWLQVYLRLCRWEWKGNQYIISNERSLSKYSSEQRNHSRFFVPVNEVIRLNNTTHRSPDREREEIQLIA